MEGSSLRSDHAVRGSSGPPHGAGRAAAGPGLLDYVRIVYRRRWLFLAVLILVSAPVGLFGVLQPTAYEARIRIVVDSEPAAPVPFKEASGGPASSDERTQQEIVRSRAVALRTIIALRLWEHPGFGGRTPRTGSSTVSEKDYEALAEPLVSGLIARTKVIAIPLSRLIDVVVEAPESQLAADIANEIGRQFIQQDLDARAASSRQNTSWLDDRLAEQRTKVEASEAALQQYKEQQDALSVEDRQNIVVQKLSDLNAAVTKAKVDRLARETANTQVARAESDPSLLDSIPEIASNGVIREVRTQLATLSRQQTELGQRYGDKHPEMIKLASAIQATEQRLATEIGKAADVVRNEYLAALNQERSLLAALDAQKNEALRLNMQDLEYGRLQREAETQRQIYDALAKQSGQAGIAGEFKESRIRVLDKAQPPGSPVRPQRARFVALALALGFFAAVGVAFAREFLESGFKTPHELHDHLQLPFLGLVPLVKASRKARKAGTAEPVFTVAAGPFSDSLRRIRATLTLGARRAGSGSTTLLVSSTAPQEGKSTLVVGLARSFVAASKRVLIIDTDLRRPCIHRHVGIDAPVGLAQYLDGQATLDDVLRQTSLKNLMVIPAGELPENPSELLGLPRFTELLEAVRPRFDWIFIDSAPVLSVPDAIQISLKADGIVFVVAAQMASRREVQLAEQQLIQSGASFAGCILNRADVSMLSHYDSAYANQKYENYYRERPAT